METVVKIKHDLDSLANAENAQFLPRFFQAFPGGYGEGDSFIGVNVPRQRAVAKTYSKLVTLSAVEALLQEAVHEYRLTALFMLVDKFRRSRTAEEKQAIAELYLRNTRYINNWDLVDSSADKILGAYLWDKPRDILYSLAASDMLWEQRISIIATFFFIKQGEYEDTLKISSMLLSHRHDLIHKAVGWMLREVGKRDYETEYLFLKNHYRQMPRTMLRYAIEKFDPEVRQQFLQGKI